MWHLLGSVCGVSVGGQSQHWQRSENIYLKKQICKDSLKEEKIGIQCHEDLLPDINMQASDSAGENRIQTITNCKSSGAGLEDTNNLISILEDEITSLQQR